jgi:hypothetical protein
MVNMTIDSDTCASGAHHSSTQHNNISTLANVYHFGAILHDIEALPSHPTF